jgi:hypothetical protein
MKRACAILLPALTLTVLSGCGSENTIPVGWSLGGNRPQFFQVTLDDRTAVSGHMCAVLSSRPFVPSRGNTVLGFGTLTQAIQAEQYHNRRIAISASVRTEEVEEWAGLWASVDGPTAVLSFDNMMARPIQGTSEWTRHRIVLDVPEEATVVRFGLHLSGPGQVSIDAVRVEPVGLAVAPTGWDPQWETSGGASQSPHPVNLDFEDAEPAT